MTPLKLIALDEDDLKVLSAHVQDAVGREADMAYIPTEQRFAVIVNRFDWSGVQKPDNGGAYERRRSAVRFDKVRKVQVQNVNPGERVMALLAIYFEPSEPPSGFLTLIFAGDAAIRLDVECIEVELRDLGAAWSTKNLPQHPDDAESAQ
ncbi:MAG: DUF2948 family protein [Hyphomicrobiales bacterium]|nr:DUF2948 family protein [Hyphomicrobiales bacterium]